MNIHAYDDNYENNCLCDMYCGIIEPEYSEQSTWPDGTGDGEYGTLKGDGYGHGILTDSGNGYSECKDHDDQGYVLNRTRFFYFLP